jgi:hypothetical protein
LLYIKVQRFKKKKKKRKEKWKAKKESEKGVQYDVQGHLSVKYKEKRVKVPVLHNKKMRSKVQLRKKIPLSFHHKAGLEHNFLVWEIFSRRAIYI